MCVKPFLRDLNSCFYPSHSTSTYTCRMTIASRVDDVNIEQMLILLTIAQVLILVYFILLMNKQNFVVYNPKEKKKPNSVANWMSHRM